MLSCISKHVGIKVRALQGSFIGRKILPEYSHYNNRSVAVYSCKYSTGSLYLKTAAVIIVTVLCLSQIYSLCADTFSTCLIKVCSCGRAMSYNPTIQCLLQGNVSFYRDWFLSLFSYLRQGFFATVLLKGLKLLLD